MNDHHDHSDATAAGIEAASSGRWKVWVSDTGHWWAALSDPLTAADLGAGCVPFLRASSPGELTRLIAGQDQLYATTRQRPARSPIAPATQPSPPPPSGEPHD